MFSFDPLYYPYSSQRMVTYAQKGMVSTTQPLAAQAGIEILQKGGNAIDAAIATAACLTVVEPNSNSIGGDSFVIVWANGELHGLNASGPAPKSISIDKLKKLGLDHIPSYGVVPITVPGTPAAWVKLSERFGKLELIEVLDPAIRYASEGYPISPTIGKYWKQGFDHINSLKDSVFKSWLATFAPNGRAPQIGEVWKSPEHAATLRSIAESNGESFYKGELAEQIESFISQHGGFLTKDDLASYSPEWVKPIKVDYRGYDVWELPPNGQGLVALQALQLLKGFSFNVKEDVDTIHKQIEAIKLAFADGLTYITDFSKMKVSVDELLNESYMNERRKLIKDTATISKAGKPKQSDTVYLATADEEGNMVSFIQSHAADFGSAVVIPGTGICLQNRGTGFSLNKEHDNALEPGKKTYHTIIPGFLTKENLPIGPFGIMCGMIQPQAHVQVISNLIDFQLNPQAALDAPRWRWVSGNKIEVEPSFPDHLAQALLRKGHQVERAVDVTMFGRGQIIWRDPYSGILVGGTEGRADSQIAVW